MSSLAIPCPLSLNGWFQVFVLLFFTRLTCGCSQYIISILYILPLVPRANLVYLFSFMRGFSLFFLILTHYACFIWPYFILPPPLPWDSGWSWCMPCRVTSVPLQTAKGHSGWVHPCIVEGCPWILLWWHVSSLFHSHSMLLCFVIYCLSFPCHFIGTLFCIVSFFGVKPTLKY